MQPLLLLAFALISSCQRKNTFLWFFKITASDFRSVFDLGSEFKISSKSFFFFFLICSPSHLRFEVLIYYYVQANFKGKLVFFRCQSTSPVLSASQPQSQQCFLGDGESGKQTKYIRTDGRFLVRAGWNNKAATLCNSSSHTSESDSQGRLTKSKSISCLDNRLSIYKPQTHNKPCQDSQGFQEQKEKQGDLSPGDGLNGRPLSWSTLSLGSSSSQSHKRTLSLPRSVAGVPPTTIRKKISEWECRRVSLPKMSLCLDKRVGERVGGSEGCPSLLPSPCSEKNFDFKGVRRMSTAFSECSYTEEEEAVLERDGVGRFQKRTGRSETSGAFVRSMSARKETSAVLNRIQKIEQSLKENPSLPPPRYLNNCYAPDKSKQKSFIIGDDFDSTCASKRSSFCSVTTEADPGSVSDKPSKIRQRFSMNSARSESPEPPSSQTSVGTPVNPLPKPKRTFEYDAKGDQKSPLPANGLPPNRGSESPPPLPSTPAPSVTRTLKIGGSSFQDRWEKPWCFCVVGSCFFFFTQSSMSNFTKFTFFRHFSWGNTGSAFSSQ